MATVAAVVGAAKRCVLLMRTPMRTYMHTHLDTHFAGSGRACDAFAERKRPRSSPVLARLGGGARAVPQVVSGLDADAWRPLAVPAGPVPSILPPSLFEHKESHPWPAVRAALDAAIGTRAVARPPPPPLRARAMRYSPHRLRVRVSRHTAHAAVQVRSVVPMDLASDGATKLLPAADIRLHAHDGSDWGEGA